MTHSPVVSRLPQNANVKVPLFSIYTLPDLSDHVIVATTWASSDVTVAAELVHYYMNYLPANNRVARRQLHAIHGFVQQAANSCRSLPLLPRVFLIRQDVDKAVVIHLANEKPCVSDNLRCA